MRIAYSDHLVDLLCQAEAAAARLAGADPDRRAATVAASRRAAARWSARLDASPLEDATADAVDAREVRGEPLVDGVVVPAAPGAARGSWARTLKLDDLPTQDVAAVEYANLLTAFDAERDVAQWFFDRPMEALADVHARITAGLVAPEDAGRPRTVELAVHDGAQGRVLYNPPAPPRIPELLDGLAAWLTGAGGGLGAAGLPAIVVAGIVHERILEWQPFVAANGRTARAAARVVLRARGVDPHGCAVVERWLAADAAGYHLEVGATMRRQDLGPWLERYAEAVVAALEHAADAVDPRPLPDLPPRAVAAVAELADGEPISLADYARRAGTALGTARQDVRALCAARLLSMEPRTRGLRFRRTNAPVPH